jgi:hypothetical protein
VQRAAAREPIAASQAADLVWLLKAPADSFREASGSPSVTA